ncbi:MAG: hypothetical protein QGH15_04345 [Kiritimatiellia bacterium]|nr:hypothetical protein [Kiritimatiellia bacterium]
MNTNSRRRALSLFLPLLISTAGAIFLSSPDAAAADTITLQNQHIKVALEQTGEAWKMARISRTDGSDVLDIHSDEFEIVLFDGHRFTVADYRCTDKPTQTSRDNSQVITVSYRRTSSGAPEQATVIYTLGEGPYLRKRVILKMKEGEKIDRLAVLHFSTSTEASLGGRGQPVYYGNWFFGMDYPCFYSRHTDGYKNPDFYYRWDYMIDLEGRDKIIAPRKHLSSLFHFPGYATKQVDGSWGILSKRAVLGLSRKKGDNAELALLDYIAETRKPTRSYLHFNNWYSAEAKKITVKNFVENTYLPMARQLARHGAKLDAMVPDHGWERTNTRIFEQALSPTHEPLPRIAEALEAEGTRLGIWIALDGTNQRFSDGIKLGYLPAYKEGFDRSQFRWMDGNKVYYDILQPKYFADLKKSLQFLVKEARVDYIKHDFNHCFVSDHISQRHAREKCVDAYLELLAYERSLHPGIYINYTNGSWFSPFWLQFVDCLWMMTGDSGGSSEWPQLSLREGATTYRCKYFHENFNNPSRCPRPVMPIANFMTHGILLSHRKPFTDFKDTLHDWANYVTMYMGRGTTLKELYLDLDLLDDDHWKVLATAARWADKHQDRLMNTVQIGGNPAAGEIYAYISWMDNKAILTVRNPDRPLKQLNVPFDHTVYFRGQEGKSYRARTVYPFVEAMPWMLTSGKSFDVSVPGDSVMIFEIEPGEGNAKKPLAPTPLPPFKGTISDDSFTIELKIPDEEFKRFDLLVQPWAKVDSSIRINGKPTEQDRVQGAARWSMSSYDLRRHRGTSVKIDGELVALSEADSNRKVAMEAWLIVDRKVNAPASSIPDLPFPISQHYRRLTHPVIPKASIVVTRVDKDTPLAKKLASSAKKPKKKK